MRITKTVRISEAYAILVHVLRGQKTPQFIIQLNYRKEFRNKEIRVKEQRKVTMKKISLLYLFLSFLLAMEVLFIKE